MPGSIFPSSIIIEWNLYTILRTQRQRVVRDPVERVNNKNKEAQEVRQLQQFTSRPCKSFDNRTFHKNARANFRWHLLLQYDQTFNHRETFMKRMWQFLFPVSHLSINSYQSRTVHFLLVFHLEYESCRNCSLTVVSSFVLVLFCSPAVLTSPKEHQAAQFNPS